VHNTNETQKSSALNNSVQNVNKGAQKVCAQNSSNGARNIDARKSSVQTEKTCTDRQKIDAKKDATKDADPLEIVRVKKRLHKAKRTLEDIKKLNIKQWTSLKTSIEKEAKTWKKCLVERKNEPQHLGPSFECDKFGLPRLTSGIKQPTWVHNRRKFLQSLTFKERNILLTGDPFVEFNPYTYILVYNYPEQINQYPNIAQNFQHIVQGQVGGQLKTPPQSPTSSSSCVLSSPEKVVKELRNRTVTTEFPYAKPKSKSWLKMQMQKVKTGSPVLKRMGRPRKPPPKPP
jgi:hypothetical protein